MELQTFSFDATPVRTVVDDTGEPWWIAADVCTVLGLEQVSRAVSRLDDDERGVTTAQTSAGSRQLTTVNESGLYQLILTSRKPEAKRFKKWITAEVLPAIRKTGQYQAPQVTEDSRITTARYLLRIAENQVETERRLSETESRVAAVETKVDTVLACTQSDGVQFMSLVGYSKLHRLNLSQRELAAAGRLLRAVCDKRGIPVKTTPSEVWGTVCLWPIDVLDEWRTRPFALTHALSSAESFQES